MKTALVIGLALLWNVSVSAQECRLKNPVPFKLNEYHRQEFYKVRVDKLPRADAHRKEDYRNGELFVRVNKIFTAVDHSGNRHFTGHMGANLDGGFGIGYGFAETYIGTHNISGTQYQSGGEQVFTTTIPNWEGEEPSEFYMTVSNGNITSLKIRVIHKKWNPRGWYVRGDGKADWVCILEMTPKPE